MHDTMDAALITRIVEAALLAANQPLTLAQLHELFPEDQPPPNDSIEQALESLREGCVDRGVELVEVASGFRFQVKSEVHAWVARLWTERQTRYTRATLETLALIAYRQPITRGEIEQVRGVAVSSNIIKALEEREWIRVVGHRDVPGKPALFGTTRAFLDYFGLKRLDELPPLSELRDIGELDPQLPFDGAPIAAGNVARDAAAGVPSTDAAANDEEVGETDDAPPADAELAVTPESSNTAVDESLSNTETPDAAPGERAADENDHADNAVETTTVFESQAAEDGAPESEKHD
jgi:segregation and condensation protein B